MFQAAAEEGTGNVGGTWRDTEGRFCSWHDFMTLPVRDESMLEHFAPAQAGPVIVDWL